MCRAFPTTRVLAALANIASKLLNHTTPQASRHRAICSLEKHFPTTVMHLQHKAGLSDEQGQRAKGILKDLLSEKFLKYLYFMMDVTKVLSTLSKTFQSDELCITDVVTSLEVKGYLDTRFGNLQEQPLSYFRVFDPREMPQERSRLASHGNNEVKSLVQHFAIYLTEEEKTSIIAQWPALRTRLARQKAMSPNDAFSNLLASRPDDVKDSLILLDLMLTLSPSTAKCEQGFSTMNHLKSNLRTTLSQNTLSDLMRMRSSDCTVKDYNVKPAISNWFSGAKTKRHIL